MGILDAIIKGLLLGMVMAVSVGPTLFAILKYSLHHSYKAGVAFIIGVSMSDLIFVLLANFAANWLELLIQFEAPIAYAGGAILILIGLIGFFKPFVPRRPRHLPTEISRSRFLTIWGSGFLINSFNPGVFITWLVAAAATAHADHLYRIALFGSCLGLILCLDVVKVFLADAIRKRLTLRRMFYLQKISALCLAGIGVVLILSIYLGVSSAHPPI